MTPKEFLMWEQTTRDTIDLKKIYIDIAGDIVSGLLLSQIIYWNLPSKEGKTKLRVEHQGKLWLAKGREDWWEECRISAKQFDRSIKILEEKGIVETTLKKFDGSPMKHIKLNTDILLEHIEKTLKIYTATEGKMNFDQRVKTDFESEEIGFSPKGKIELTERVNSLTEITTENTKKITSTDAYINLPVDADSKIKIYELHRNNKFHKAHKKLKETDIEDIKEWLGSIDHVDDAMFEEVVVDYFKNLPAKNDGDIRPFIKASKRLFEVDPPGTVRKTGSKFNDYSQRKYSDNWYNELEKAHNGW